MQMIIIVVLPCGHYISYIPFSFSKRGNAMVTVKIHDKMNRFEMVNGVKPEVLILGKGVYRRLCEEARPRRALSAFRGASIVVVETMDILIDCGSTGSMNMLARCHA